MLDEKCSPKTALYKSRFIVISVALSAVSYKIALDILKKSGKVIEFYNNQITPLSDLPEHIILAIKLGFSNLVNYNVAFMPLSVTILFALFLVAFLVFLWQTNLNKNTKLSILILLCGAILASQMHIILSKTIITSDPRVQYYGLMFLRVLFVALAFKVCIDFIRAQKLAQNLLFILSTILIWFCIVQDLNAQKLQKLSNDAELKLLNRVIDRIEQNENFNPNKQYCGIWIGDLPNFRERYSGKRNGNELISVTFITWATGSFDKFMSSAVFKQCGFVSPQQHKKQFKSIIFRLEKADILDKLEPFPHKDSVVVFEDIIVFVASKGNLDEIRKMVKESQ